MTARPLSVPVPMRPHIELELDDDAAAWRCPTCSAEKWTPRRYVRLNTLCYGCGRAVEWEPIDA